jgi:hypothetical protein
MGFCRTLNSPKRRFLARAEEPGPNGDLSERAGARGMGRPSKVDRQEMVGTWAALRRWTQTVCRVV